MPYINTKHKKIWYNRKGDGFPLILLHDGFYNSSSWDPVYDILSSHFTVISYDRFGYGRSDLFKSRLDHNILDYYSEELHELIDALKLKELYLCGHCLGGAIALEYTLKYPRKVKKIVAESVGFYSDDKIMMKSDWTFRPFHKMDENLRADLVKMNGLDYAKRFWEILRAYKITYIMAEGYNILPKMKKITCPVFLIYGDRDIYFDLEHALKAYKSFKKAQLWVVPDTFHTPHKEKREDFVQNVLQFLPG
jgi:pimeloyl-ACP methyl ester carboxylesterase